MRAHNSLLPRGVVAVEGRFERGAVVMVNDEAKAITNLSSMELEDLRGKRSDQPGGRSGSGSSKVVARPDDIVFMDE
jgi:glutamate 5-kinase